MNDYCQTEKDYSFDLPLDLNSSKPSCGQYNCVESKEEAGACTCTRQESVLCGTHTEQEWQKTGNFFGFDFEKGKKYRLRIWGKRTPEKNAGGIDWILTLNGRRLTEFDWWLSNWDSKYPINSLVISDDLNSDNWINLQGVNFSSLNIACGNADDLTIVNESSGVEVTDLNFQNWDGTSTDTNVNVAFKLTEALPASTYNGEYYIYSNNNACPSPTNRAPSPYNHDDFEDGTIALWTATNTNGGTMGASTSANKFGSYGGRMTTDGSNDNAGINYYNYTTTGTTGNYYTWFRISNVNGYAYYELMNADYYTLGFISCLNGAFYYGYSGQYAWTITPSANTWYRLRIVYNGSSAGSETYDAYIYDTGNNLLESHLGMAVQGQGAGGGGAAAKVDLYGRDKVAGAYTIDWDNTAYTNSEELIQPSYSIGSEETQSSPPDANVLYPINNESFNARNTIDINIAISDPDTNAQGITIDINYSTTQTEGTGTSICNDCNLSTSLNCDSNNLSTSQQCKYSWNTSGIPAGNYYILAKVSDPNGNNDFNAGTGTFTLTTAPTSGTLRINANLNATKKLTVGQDANFLGNVKIEGTLFGGSPVKMKGGINVEGGITSDDYKYQTPEGPISLLDQILKILESIQKLFNWNAEQDQRITALENELCKYNEQYSWCN